MPMIIRISKMPPSLPIPMFKLYLANLGNLWLSNTATESSRSSGHHLILMEETLHWGTLLRCQRITAVNGRELTTKRWVPEPEKVCRA